MLALERQREILALLGGQGSVRVNELAQRFDVAEETIRRDLDKLEAEGRLVRDHGGAVAALEAETPLWQREFVHAAEKEAIAREASHLVESGDTLILDASSTSWFLARRLPDLPLTVITNALQIVQVLADRSSCKVICPGGTLVAASLSFVGSETQAFLRRYHARRLFVSCRGLDVQRGACDLSEEQSMVRRVMMEISDERHLLVDGSKLGVRALSVIAPLGAFTSVITDNRSDPAFCQSLEQQGIRLVRAEVFGRAETTP